MFAEEENTVEPEETTAENDLEKALAEEREKAEQLMDSLKRTQADFINYRRRSQLEIGNKVRATRCDVILELLPVLDDLERALAAVPERLKKQPWVEGVSMVERKFKAILESQGICAIEALGQPFDPNYHEAMRRDKGEEGVILEEYRKGYKIQDKLLRPAQVVVGTSEEDTKEDEE